jgi:hypothetical protein
MEKISLTLSLLVFCLGAAVHAQEHAPPLLVRAAHCLAVKGFLPSSRAKTSSFGYILDDKSYPGEKVFYLVEYAAPSRSSGLVFAVFFTEHDGRQTFDIQNNTSFVLSRNVYKSDFDGVSFVSPPLGGDWTQEHLAAAIQQIEKQPRFAIPIRDLLAAPLLTDCESYTDR